MKPPLGDTLVICDMDNTLLTAKEGIPACNRAVIRLYTSLGGLFTVATGRPPESIRACLLYTSPSPRDISGSRMPSSA